MVSKHVRKIFLEKLLNVIIYNTCTTINTKILLIYDQ